MEIRKVGNNHHHECEIFLGREQEAAESEYKWLTCGKNPGHEQFFSIQDFKDNHLQKVQNNDTVKSCEFLRSCIDLTVRLRVHFTSTQRPDDGDFSKCRGTTRLRTGTGFVQYVVRSKENEPCSCNSCDGNVGRKHWRFLIQTAHHAAYNTEEAKETEVDFFFDYDSCERDGRMESLPGVKVTHVDSDRDLCIMECVTHNEDLGERIWSAWSCLSYTKLTGQDLSVLDLLPSRDGVSEPALIVSHPHGQPKKITVGEMTRDGDHPRMTYTTPTCPGSSGAPVIQCQQTSDKIFGFFFYTSVHCGRYNMDRTATSHQDQLNFGFYRLLV